MASFAVESTREFDTRRWRRGAVSSSSALALPLAHGAPRARKREGPARAAALAARARGGQPHGYTKFFLYAKVFFLRKKVFSLRKQGNRFRAKREIDSRSKLTVFHRARARVWHAPPQHARARG